MFASNDRDERVLDAVTSYEAGEHPRDIAARIAVSESCVYRWLKQQGLTRSRSEAARKHSIDEGFFSSIETEAQAYWLGFLLADGCVTDRNRVSVRLASIDSGHVEKFRADIKSTHPVFRIPAMQSQLNGRICNSSESVQFHFRSTRMTSDLQALGISPRKSLTAVPPQVAEHLRRHFWRGVFDGDGGMWRGTPKKPGATATWGACLVGSRATVAAFAAACEAIGVHANVLRHEKIWEVRLVARRLVAVLRWLYDGASVYLDRKRVLTEACITEYSQRRDPKVGMLVAINGTERSVAEWSKLSGTREDTIRYRLRNGWAAEKAVYTPRATGGAKRRNAA